MPICFSKYLVIALHAAATGRLQPQEETNAKTLSRFFSATHEAVNISLFVLLLNENKLEIVIDRINSNRKFQFVIHCVIIDVTSNLF